MALSKQRNTEEIIIFKKKNEEMMEKCSELNDVKALILNADSVKTEKVNVEDLEKATGLFADGNENIEDIFGCSSEDEIEKIVIRRVTNYAMAQELLSGNGIGNGNGNDSVEKSLSSQLVKFKSMKSYIDFKREQTSEIIAIIRRLTNYEQDSIENEMLNNERRLFQYLESMFNYTVLSLNICQIIIGNEDSRLILPLYNKDGKPLVYGICSKAHNNGNNNNNKNKDGYAWVIEKMCSFEQLWQRYKQYYESDVNAFRSEIDSKLNDKNEISNQFSQYDASLRIEVSKSAVAAIKQIFNENCQSKNKCYKTQFWLKIKKQGFRYDDIKRLLYNSIKDLRQNAESIQYQINANTKQNKLIVECVMISRIGNEFVGWPMEYLKNEHKYVVITSLTPQMLQHNCLLFDCIEPLTMAGNSINNIGQARIVNDRGDNNDNGNGGNAANGGNDGGGDDGSDSSDSSDSSDVLAHFGNQLLHGQLRLMAMEGIESARQTMRIIEENMKIVNILENWQVAPFARSNLNFKVNEIAQNQMYYNESVIDMINYCDSNGMMVDIQKCIENLIASANCSIFCRNVINGQI